MRKRKVRCFVAYVEVNGIYNNKIYYTIGEGWSNLDLATCINCAELFVVDRENPKTDKLSLKEIAKGNKCDNCNSSLEDTIRPYPQFFRTENGNIGSFTPPNIIESESEPTIIEVTEIIPI